MSPGLRVTPGVSPPDAQAALRGPRPETAKVCVLARWVPTSGTDPRRRRGSLTVAEQGGSRGPRRCDIGRAERLKAKPRPNPPNQNV
jgi:hypothetical protein